MSNDFYINPGTFTITGTGSTSDLVNTITQVEDLEFFKSINLEFPDSCFQYEEPTCICAGEKLSVPHTPRCPITTYE